jgi:Zn-dependent metalloprotease
LNAVAHYSQNYNNAFWDGTEMIYGDGDGVLMSPLSLALDVVAHELTHAVTQYTSALVYQNQPGALNEAMSDILGSSCEAWKAGGVSSKTWMIGEDIWKPATPGEAMRYMNNPTKDGVSSDYYPERYLGTKDKGDVHWNSGIANLAYYLVVQGGRHPRAKTNFTVTGIGIDKARAIFYRADSQYLSSNSAFADARAATAQAAADLYSAAEVSTVNWAWATVGVGDAPQ